MRRETITERRLQVHIFESVDEHVDLAFSVRERYKHLGYSTQKVWESALDRERQRFIGRPFGTWREISDAVKSVWPEGMGWYDEMIEALRNSELPRPQSLKRQRVWRDDAGDELCLDRLKRGQPYWQTTRREHRPGPVSISIIAQLGGSAAINSKELLWRGLACIALTEVLEQAGYRVELWGASYVTSLYKPPNQNYLMAINLKRGCDLIVPSSIVNIMSGWYHRTVTFAGRCDFGAPDGCGGITTDVSAVSEFITQDTQTVFCQDIYNQEDATDWAKAQVAKLANPNLVEAE